MATTFGDYPPLNEQENEMDNMSRRPPLAGRWFQLKTQEEGGESSLLLVFLNPDGTVSGGSIGPTTLRWEGVWEQEDEEEPQKQKTVLSLTLAFDQLSKGLSSISDNFKRTFTGECHWEGGKLSSEGKIIEQGNGGREAEVGLFQMIDTTDEVEKRCLDSY